MISDLPHCPIPGDIVHIAAPQPSFADGALSLLLEPFQPLREQLIAITGLGLEAEADGDPASLRRLGVIAGPGQAGSGLSVLAAGQPGGRRVIFIHGSPGLAEEWSPFLTDIPDGRLYLAPDRPGYGDSAANPLIELQDQADTLVPLLGPPSRPPVILVGYSYGGPVALRLAADHPERVAGVLLVAAAADPGLEEVHPLQQIAALDFFQQMLPAELAHSNAELMALRPGLETLAADLSAVVMPVTILQGTADNLVPAPNADYLRALLPAAPASVMVEDADHFLPWTHAPLLRDALDCLLQDADAQRSGALER